MGKFGKIYAGVASLVVVVLFCLLVFLRNLPSEALVAFIGVLVGSTISSFAQYAMSEANMRQQLRLAAFDKRLQTAQEAMTIWHRLSVVDENKGEELGKVLNDSKQWWDTHSLYLTSEARKAFYKAYCATGDLAIARARHADWDEMKALSTVIDHAAKIIVESVYLPPISELESSRTKTLSNKHDV